MRQDELHLLSEVYKGCQMGLDSLSQLTPEIPDDQMLKSLSGHTKELVEIQQSTINMADKENDNIDAVGFIDTMKAKGIAKIHMMKSSDKNHIARMLIEGSKMGVTNVQPILKEDKNIKPEVRKIAEKFVQMEEENIEEMKKFL